jgi:hypothetical protein
MREHVFTVVAMLILLTVQAAAQQIPPEQAEAIIRDLQDSHIGANVPPQDDFNRLLQRDIEAYFRSKSHPNYNVRYEMLRDGPTQSGIAYPKFYVWVRVSDRDTVVREGAAQLAAIARERFEVTHFIERAEIERDRAQLQMVFPAAVVSMIESKIRAK